MRESVGSLRAFFLLVGLYGCYSSWQGLDAAMVFFHVSKTLGGLNLLLLGLGGLLSVGYVGLGLQLPALLATNSGLVSAFVWLNILVNAVASGLLVFISPGAAAVLGIGFLFSLLINLYLLSSISKLSRGG